MTEFLRSIGHMPGFHIVRKVSVGGITPLFFRIYFYPVASSR